VGVALGARTVKVAQASVSAEPSVPQTLWAPTWRCPEGGENVIEAVYPFALVRRNTPKLTPSQENTTVTEGKPA
jgi:hypothetical protein